MSNIIVKPNPSEEELRKLGVAKWPIWTKEVSKFPWHYDEEETCYLLEGEITVTPEGQAPVSFGKGDLVTFPTGMSCVWDIRKAVRKHYRLG